MASPCVQLALIISRRRVTEVSVSTLSIADLRYPSVFYACGFGSGMLPKAPGTWGSVLGVVLWVLTVGHLSPVWQALVFALVFVLGVIAIGAMQKRFGVMDAPEIVIDEILGVWIALLFAPMFWWVALLGFLAFRLFDIWKPWPVSWADRIHTPTGVMLDDVIAGLMALAVVQGVLYAL